MIGRGPLVNKRDARAARNNASSRHLARGVCRSTPKLQPPHPARWPNIINVTFVLYRRGENVRATRDRGRGRRVVQPPVRDEPTPLLGPLDFYFRRRRRPSARTHPRAAIYRTRVYLREASVR